MEPGTSISWCYLMFGEFKIYSRPLNVRPNETLTYSIPSMAELVGRTRYITSYTNKDTSYTNKELLFI